MKLLLDTHIFLWSLLEPEKLTDETVELLDNPETEKYLSAASSWEIAIKYAKGSIILPQPPTEFILKHASAAGIRLLPITVGETLETSSLPLHHKDPFDRILIAQARLNDMFLVTNDRMLAEYHVPIIEI